jgi:DNA mismatch endonuclease (patch repair protein)
MTAADSRRRARARMSARGANSAKNTTGADLRAHRAESARSRTMRAIRKKNTKPELVVRRLLHGLGLRFRLHRRDLPGSPDIVLPRHRAVVLVHGCFWHQHPGCRHGNKPRVRTAYWLPKLARNVARDAQALAALRALGWRALVVWECELRDVDAVRDRLAAFIQASPAAAPTPARPYPSPDALHGFRAARGSAWTQPQAAMAEEAEPAPAAARARARRRPRD